MRTRIALAAATSATLIGSTAVLVTVLGADDGPSSSRGTSARLAQQAGGVGSLGLRRQDGVVVSATDLRTTEQSGQEPIGTFSPLVAQGDPHPGQRSAPSPTPASTSFSSTISIAPAQPVPAPAAPAQPPPAQAPPAQATPAVTETTTAAPPPPAPPAPPPPAPPPPAPPAPPPPTDWSSTATSDWQCIRVHESGDVYNDPARPSGAYGILDGTWLSLGYHGWPYQYSAAVQDQAALTLYHEYGWRPWSSRYACGL